MINWLKLLVVTWLMGVTCSTAFAFVAVFPISGLVPATGEIISGRYWISDAMSNPETISLRVGGKTCNGLLHQEDDGRSSGEFTCEDRRRAVFKVQPEGFFVLKSNPNGRFAAQYSLVGQGEIAGETFTIEFNTVLPAPFIFP